MPTRKIAAFWHQSMASKCLARRVDKCRGQSSAGMQQWRRDPGGIGTMGEEVIHRLIRVREGVSVAKLSSRVE